VATRCTLLQHGARGRNVLHWAATCCTGSQSAALGCNVLYCGADRELKLSHRRSTVRSPA
jgi:hypothetical protein